MGAIPDAEWRRVHPPASLDPHLQDRWQRLWLENRRSRGDDALAAMQALSHATLRTAMFALDRQADALVLPSDAAGTTAWNLLPPRSTQPCADLFWADLHGEFGCLPWPNSEPALAANTVKSAATLTGAHVVWVNFRGSEVRLPASSAKERALLDARLPLITLDVYSPFYFGDGRLLADPLLQKIRALCGRPLQFLLLIPGLDLGELALAIRAANGTWAGPFRLGAEIPAARLESNCRPADARLTLDFLARLARS